MTSLLNESPPDGSSRRPTFKQSCWKRRTVLEKSLLLTALLLILTVVALIVVATWPRKSKEDICLKEECVRISGRILETMDSGVDPCDDFFEYACGTWNRANAIPDDKSSYNTFRKLSDELQGQLRALIEEPMTKNEIDAKRKAKNLYRSCMNTTAIELRQQQPLMELLSEIGGWPVLDRHWTPSGFVLEEQMARLRLLNIRALVNHWVGADDKNSSIHVIVLDQPTLGMPSRDYFLKPDARRTLTVYRELATNVAKALGATDDEDTQRQINDMVDFEVKLATMMMPEDNRRDTEAIYNKLKVSELYRHTKHFDWLRYLRFVYGNMTIDINDADDVVVYALKYLSDLGDLLHSTPNKTIANYLMWQVVHNRINHLSQKFLDLRRGIIKALSGTDQEQPRWRICVSYVNEHLGMAVGRMFVERHFHEDSRANAMSMIENIRDAFVELLGEAQWMDESTREFAREKAAAIQERIGYPDYIMNDTALNSDLEEVQPDITKYFENTITNLRIVARNSLKSLRQPVDKSIWAATPAIVNAFYSAIKNQIIFPAGILQPPFYHATYPKSINFGGIATVIGHELTHAFDDKGRQYDKDGNLKQWWPDNVISRFKDKAQCIIDQYNNYTVKEVRMNLNGKQTQGENIADSGGLKQAFRAYSRWVERTNAEESHLPGLSLSHKQLFFLNFAQIWCGTSRPESYVQAIRIGRHSPGRFRVIGPLSNSKDFAEAYRCKLGSRMNPVKKCSVW